MTPSFAQPATGSGNQGWEELWDQKKDNMFHLIQNEQHLDGNLWSMIDNVGLELIMEPGTKQVWKLAMKE